MSVCVCPTQAPQRFWELDLDGSHLMQRLIYGVPRPDMSSQNTIFSIFHFDETSEQQPIKPKGEKNDTKLHVV